MEVLMVNNDRQIKNFMKQYADLEGFKFDESHNIEEAIERLHKTKYDIVIIDFAGHNADGLELLKIIREETSAPLILTSKVLDYEKSPYFNKENDEFLQKPFKPGELLQKMRAVAKRIMTEPELMQIRAGVLRIDEINRKVFADDIQIELEELEFKLISVFARNSKQVLTVDQLLDLAWNGQGDRANLIQYIKSLRAKLGKYRGYITNLVNKGYVFNPEKGKVL